MKRVDHLCIFTDASFNCREHLASYAFVVTLNGKEARYADHFTFRVDSSTDAEMLAFAHAINFLLSKNWPKNVRCMTIFMDNKRAIEQITKQTPGIGMKTNIQWQRLIDKLGSKENVMKHVKAHTDEKGRRFLLNEWCDKHARIKLRELRGKVVGPHQTRKRKNAARQLCKRME